VPSFIFLWCGSGGRVTEDVERGPLHVDDGRRLLKKWGYRRCEEVCWIKTNKEGALWQPDLPTSTTSLLVRTKEHCLMGIKGSVRRNRDGHLLHCNVHTDIVVAEQPTDPLSLRKPEEMYRIMEHFAMGRRRLELFGCPHNVRPGWVTLGNQLRSVETPATKYDRERYLGWMREPGVNPDGTPCAGHLLGSTPLIEELRPKTPPREAAVATAAAIGATGGFRGAATAAAVAAAAAASISPPPASPRVGPAGERTGGAGLAARGPLQSPRPGSVAPVRGRPGQGGSGGGSMSSYGASREQDQYQYHHHHHHQHSEVWGGARQAEEEAAAASHDGGGQWGGVDWGSRGYYQDSGGY